MSTIRPGQALNEFMEFDHVIRVHEDGTISDDVPNIRAYWAPDLVEGELHDGSGWELMTGYSGQDRYNGPHMHDSEFIGGGLERDIRTTPGLYVALAVDYTSPVSDDDHDYEEGPYSEGWVVAYKPLVSLLKRPCIYVAGSYCTFAEDGSGVNHEEHGWINPSWSMKQLYEDRPSPAQTYDRDDYLPGEPECERAYWVAHKLHDLVGYIDSVSGNVFYAADPYDDLEDPLGTLTLSVIVEHLTDPELDRVVEILSSKQGGYKVTVA